MHRAINYVSDEKNLNIIDSQMNNSIALSSDDDWDVESFLEIKKYISRVHDTDYIELSCLDITQSGAIEAAETFRSNNPDGMLVLISDYNVSPLSYMKPSVMACSLLLKPVNLEDAKKCFKEVLKSFPSDKNSECTSNDKKFAISSKEGTSFFPFGKILYFEAREKKLFLNTVNSEIGFYGTLDTLINELPSNFVRCHRGFIVNTEKIVKVIPSENTIYLTDNAFVPLSRGYKNAIKETLEKM